MMIVWFSSRISSLEQPQCGDSREERLPGNLSVKLEEIQSKPSFLPVVIVLSIVIIVIIHLCMGFLTLPYALWVR